MRTLSSLWPILILAALPAAAAELTLDEALRLARSESFRLQAAGHAVAAAGAEVRSARAELMPSLEAVATWVDYDGDVFYNRFVTPTGVPDPTAPPTDVGSFSSTGGLVLRVSQPLYAGGALRSQVRARRVERRIAEVELRRVRLDLDYEVTAAYYGVLLAERAVEVAGQSVRRSEETLEMVRRRRAAEEALKVEELAAESHLAADRHRRRGAENDLRFARLAFRRLLANRLPEDELRLTDPLAAAPRQLDEERAVERAVAGHPAVARGELRLALADELAAAAGARARPKLELEGYHAWIDSETFFEGTTFGFDLKVSIPFLRDAVAAGGARARAAAGRALEASTLEEVSSAIALRARQAARAVEEAYGAVEVARQALDYQREKQRVTASAFREQLATADQLMTEDAALAEAVLRLYGAQHQARLAEAELDRVAGGGG